MRVKADVRGPLWVTGSRPECPTGKSLLIFRSRVKPPLQKYFASLRTQISSLICRPVSTRGALRTSSTRGGMRWTRQRASIERRMMLMRTAKSCRSDAPIVGVKSAIRSAGDGVKKRGHRGEREVSRKTIARGMPGEFRCDRGDYARVLVFICTRGCGCSWAPGIPCALCYQSGERFMQNLGRIAPRECGVASEIGATTVSTCATLSAVIARSWHLLKSTIVLVSAQACGLKQAEGGDMTGDQFAALLDEFTRSAESGSGARFAGHFTEDAIYYDYIYGAHKGRAEIAHMMQNLFHRDAADYRWEMFDPVFDGEKGYAWSLSSFTSKIPQFAGKARGDRRHQPLHRTRRPDRRIPRVRERRGCHGAARGRA